jgi:hypothetical protein
MELPHLLSFEKFVLTLKEGSLFDVSLVGYKVQNIDSYNPYTAIVLIFLAYREPFCANCIEWACLSHQHSLSPPMLTNKSCAPTS